MPAWRRAIIISLLVLASSGQIARAGEASDAKIRNGKLLAEKAIDASGDSRTDYLYKAVREFERASAAEPENPWPYYWQAVLKYRLENDSLGAEKLYNTALKSSDRSFAASPSPWAYKNDADIKSAFKGQFSWASSEPSKPAEVKNQVRETKTDPLESLRAAIQNENYPTADSTYQTLAADPLFVDKVELFNLGLQLKLAENSPDDASALLKDFAEKKGRRSSAFKKGVELYDSKLDLELSQAKKLARNSNYGGADSVLTRWEPNLSGLTTPARGRLLLEYSSIMIYSKNIDAAGSALTFYEKSGYDKNENYNKLKDSLSSVNNPPTELAKNDQPIKAEMPQKKKESSSDGYVTVNPPSGEIVKIVVKTIDPNTGKVESTDLWDTASPTELKTGSSYKLVILKKQERKTPKYIVTAGILATFLMVR
jgi:hypothetical protein